MLCSYNMPGYAGNMYMSEKREENFSFQHLITSWWSHVSLFENIFRMSSSGVCECAYICLLKYIFTFPYSWNDLIVGAPFYFDRMKDHGGAVYIFLNENGSFQKTATMVLRGPSSSAFGFAVAAIGDVNQDGFQGRTFILHHQGTNQIKCVPLNLRNCKAENLIFKFLLGV